MLLPDIADRKAYEAVFPTDAVWLPAVRAICRRHRLDPHAAERPALGSNIVFRTHDRIIKLYPPIWPEDGLAEMAVLPNLDGLPTPGIVCTGEIEGWRYLIMTVAEGVPAVDLWRDLERAQRLDLIRQLGRLMRRLHDHSAVPQIDQDWNAFLAERIAGSEAHHAAEEPWRSWIAERVLGFSEPPFQPVLLNADITADHLLLTRSGRTWTISGLIDFGDAMMGHPFYEFAAPFCFYTFGTPELTHALVEAYGLQLTPHIAHRLTTYCLLHRFGTLESFRKSFSVADGPAFHRALWGDLS